MSKSIIEQAQTWLENYEEQKKPARPKRDFEEALKNDFNHAQGLEQLIQALKKMGQRIEVKQTKSAADMLQLERVRFEMNERIEQLTLHQKIIADKVRHFSDFFLPMYEKRLAHVQEKFPYVYESVKKYVEDNEDPEDMKWVRVNQYLNQYQDLSKEERMDIEIKAKYFIDWKNILGVEL